MDFPGGLAVKNLPVIQEMRVGSLVQEDSLEEKMANHSNILPWRIPWTEEPGGLQSVESQRVHGCTHICEYCSIPMPIALLETYHSVLYRLCDGRQGT